MGTKINYNELMKKLEWNRDVDCPVTSLDGMYSEFNMGDDSSAHIIGIRVYIKTEYLDDYYDIIDNNQDITIYLRREDDNFFYGVRTIEEFNNALMSIHYEYMETAQDMIRMSLMCDEYKLK